METKKFIDFSETNNGDIFAITKKEKVLLFTEEESELNKNIKVAVCHFDIKNKIVGTFSDFSRKGMRWLVASLIKDEAEASFIHGTSMDFITTFGEHLQKMVEDPTTNPFLKSEESILVIWVTKDGDLKAAVFGNENELALKSGQVHLMKE